MNAERAKRLDMVSVLRGYYGVNLSRCGERYVCRSPLTGENDPSFYVWRSPEGHWVYKDFSSNTAGSLIDLVREKEGTATVSEALAFIGAHIAPHAAVNGVSADSQSAEATGNSAGSYDIGWVYERCRGNDTGVVVDYLTDRGIDRELVGDLVRDGIVVHNRHRETSYCCFAVHDDGGRLRCLDNHEVGGSGKFVLGTKRWFSLEHAALAQAGEVYVCEGIIDYLSVKTLEGRDIAGVALLGNQVSLAPDIFRNARLLVSVFDADRGGVEGFMDLQSMFPDKEFSVYRTGECKDANAYLQHVRGGGSPQRFTAMQKLRLYEEFTASDNKKALAARWGINRSYMYEVVEEARAMVVGGFENRRRGRKPGGRHGVRTLEDALERIAVLEAEKDGETADKERYYARSEFLKIRLKWSEIENAELRGEVPAERGDEEKTAKRQAKKKRRKRR